MTGKREDHVSGPMVNEVVSALFVKYAQRVYGFALKGCQGNKHDAEEIVNETFISVQCAFVKHFAGKDPQEIERNLFMIAGRRVIDMYRRARNLPLPTADLDHLIDAAGPSRQKDRDPVYRVVDQETLEQLRTVLTQILTRTEHQVAFLTWQMGLPDRVIVELLGIPTVGAVRTHRSNAKTKIKTHVGDGISFPDESWSFSDGHDEGITP